jgi:rRNA-processing protein FCF1
MSSLEMNAFEEYLGQKTSLFIAQTCFHQLEKFSDAKIEDKKNLFNNCVSKSETLMKRLEKNK